MPKRQPDLRLRPAALRLHDEALLFAALGDETRLALLRQLAQAGPASISTLAHNFRVSRQAFSSSHWPVSSKESALAGSMSGRSIRSASPKRSAASELLREVGTTRLAA
jgi:DNA-binding transcriptional ArsR family regulator